MDSKLIRRIFLASLAFILATIVPSADNAIIFQDLFNRVDNTDLGASWDSGYTGTFTNLQIVSNAVESTSVATNDALETINTAVPANQFAQFTITTRAAGTSSAQAVVRFAAPSTVTGYLCIALTGANGYIIGKYVTGSFTTLKSSASGAWANNDILTCEANGSIIRMYKNTTLLDSATDTAITSGRAGIDLFAVTALNTIIVDNFNAGKITSLAGFMFALNHAPWQDWADITPTLRTTTFKSR